MRKTRRLLALVVAALLLLTAQAPVLSAEGEEASFTYYYNTAYTKNSPSNASTPERLQAVSDYIYSQCGVRVNPVIVAPDNLAMRLNMALSDGEVDAFMAGHLNRGDARALYEMGITMDLSDKLAGYPNILNLWKVAGETTSDNLWDIATADDGAVYCIPDSTPMSGSCVYVRKDWLDALNLEVPQTVEDFEKCLAAVQAADPYGNGGTIPMHMDANIYNVLAAGYTGEGYGTYYLTDEGGVDLYANLPGMKDLVSALTDWYGKDYIYKEYLTMTTQTNLELIKTGRVFAFAGWHSTATMCQSDISAMGGEFVPLGELKGPAGSYARTMSSPACSGLVIAANSENADAVLKYLDWEYASLDNYLTAMYGIKGVDWEEGVPGELKTRTVDYVSECTVAPMFAFTMQMNSSDPVSVGSFWYYANMLLDADRSVSNSFENSRYLMNLTDLAEDTSSDDINRMLSEELTKFIMGDRPIEEYDAFLDELKQAKSEQLLEYLTAKYDEVK